MLQERLYLLLIIDGHISARAALSSGHIIGHIRDMNSDVDNHLDFLHYEDLAMQYTNIFSDVKI